MTHQRHGNGCKTRHAVRWQGRLFFIMGLPRGPMGRRRVWLVVFKTRAISEWMRRPYSGFSTLLHYAIDHKNIN